MVWLKHVISIRDMSKEDILFILKRADKFIPAAKGKKTLRNLAGKVLCLLFFESSTRTRFSFETAMKRLGGEVIGIDSLETTSIRKGESFIDTVRVFAKYADAVVIRHPLEGAARYVSEVVDIPVINGGDGANQHPTQTFLDLFTILKEKKRLNNIKVTLVGDLKYARTIRSLVYALAMFGIDISFCSPKTLEFPKEPLEEIKEKFNNYPKVYHNIPEAVSDADVVYVVRIQKERFPDPKEYQAIQSSYKIDLDVIKHMKEDAILMHPLPRLDEIPPEIDNVKQAIYFKQAFYGCPVRMAVLDAIMGG
jgi:aspartate carbamoyltransferase catalytic subunit